MRAREVLITLHFGEDVDTCVAVPEVDALRALVALRRLARPGVFATISCDGDHRSSWHGYLTEPRLTRRARTTRLPRP